MALAEKKVVDATMALVVTNMIIASVSLEQAQVEASAIEPVSVPNPALVLQKNQSAEGEEQSKDV